MRDRRRAVARGEEIIVLLELERRANAREASRVGGDA
jgi:hypothetical protein